MKTFFWFLVLMEVIGMFSCSPVRNRQSASPVAHEMVFPLPEIPVMIQSAEARLLYLAEHYWHDFDFADTLYLQELDVLEQSLVDYLDLLFRISPTDAERCLIGLLESSLSSPLYRSYLVETLRHYLWDPNSPFRREDMYATIARFCSNHPAYSEEMRLQAQHDLKLFLSNRVSSVSTDFVCTFSSGKQICMHDIICPYLLLVFYNPDCDLCVHVLKSLQESLGLQYWIQNKGLKVLAFYPEEDVEKWRTYHRTLPRTWMHAFDASMAVIQHELYDLKAMPTLYLLDKSKKVLLKDVGMEQLEQYFQNKIP